ncbi:putative phosphatidate phosphatase [Drosophila novamexicana]|uniref:putative phosphatidate phosphatase n=1 Tax=Drosophila novamexicana TaxID=47314 RepID=UPI0011E5B40D|nr:putative phosphatidate phosphatase [Drosophila novamexicana]
MSFDLRINWLSIYQGHLRLLLDVVLLGVLLVLGANVKNMWGPTTKRGFFCDDETLMYPYQENTVSPTVLHWTSLHLPLMALLILETSRCWRTAGVGWQKFWPVYNTLRWFVFGHAAETLIKDMGKQVIGRLRPHFFEVCRPQLFDGGFCADDAHRQGGVYHMTYTCQPELSGATAEVLRDVHVSFPSGHSSMAFYGLVFMALHLQRIRWPLPGSLVRPSCQLLCVGFASFVGLSRVMDYKHHWSDVVAGSLLGASIAFAVVRAAGQEQQFRLKSMQQHANTMEPQAAAVAKAGAGDEVGPGAEQLAHDLCQITFHSSN